MYESSDLYRVTAANNSLTVESRAIRQDVFLGLDGFLKMLPSALPRRIVDLLVIATSAYAIDRIVSRTALCEPQGGIRCLEASIAVQDPEFWARPQIQDSLCETLTFLTGDDWSFSFSRAPENGYQHSLPLPWAAPRRVALFSEGLDSAAGLADQAANARGPIMTVTVAHYSALRRRTERQIRALTRHLPNSTIYPASLVVGLRHGLARRMRDQEVTQRSRGFLFCSAGIAAACAHRVERIDLYESGPGAINLPLMTGMLFGGMATRGAHPTFLNKMSVLGSLIADRPVSFYLPYLGVTKGEMLAKAQDLAVVPWLQQSRSCVHTSLRVPDVTHCGVCPACIERRQAFSVAAIQEDPALYDVDVFKDVVQGPERTYFDLFTDAAAALEEEDPRTLRRLRTYMAVTDLKAEDYPRIHTLLLRHAKEVRKIFENVPAARPTDPIPMRESAEEIYP